MKMMAGDVSKEGSDMPRMVVWWCKGCGWNGSCNINSTEWVGACQIKGFGGVN
jgi:hypothetical protein